MIVYHGSNTTVTEINLLKCRPYKDFGRGFYLTDIREQAEKMAQRMARLYGGTPFVSAFNFNETALCSYGLRTLAFEHPCKDWALFVMNNRDKKFNDIGCALCNQDNKYDIVAGPVANDDIAFLFRTFTRGLIDIEALVRGLEYKELTSQYSFHTEESLKYLLSLEG